MEDNFIQMTLYLIDVRIPESMENPFLLLPTSSGHVSSDIFETSQCGSLKKHLECSGIFSCCWHVGGQPSQIPSEFSENMIVAETRKPHYFVAAADCSSPMLHVWRIDNKFKCETSWGVGIKEDQCAFQTGSSWKTTTMFHNEGLKVLQAAPSKIRLRKQQKCADLLGTGRTKSGIWACPKWRSAIKLCH